MEASALLPSGPVSVSASAGRPDATFTIAGLAPVHVISPDFPLKLTGFFPGKHLIHFLVLKMKDFRNFVLDNLTLNKFT